MRDFLSTPIEFIHEETEYGMMHILAIAITFASIFTIQKEVDDFCFFNPRCCLFCLFFAAVVGRLISGQDKSIESICKNLLVGTGMYFSITYFSVVFIGIIVMEVALIIWIGTMVFKYVFIMRKVYKKRIFLSKVPWKLLLKSVWNAEVFIKGLILCQIIIPLLTRFFY